MNRLGKLLTSEVFLFLFFSIIIISAGTIATPYRSLIAKPDTIYDGTEFWSDDYSIYASNILQGQKGRWTLLDKHTSEPHAGTIIHDEYLLWGKLMGLLGFDNIQAYHLGRIVFGGLLLFSLYSLLRLLFPKKVRTPWLLSQGFFKGQSETPYRKPQTAINLHFDKVGLSGTGVRLLAFFLILFSANFPIITKSPEGQTIIRNHMEWFTEIDVFQRFTVLMHYLLGNIFFLLSLIFLLKTFLGQKISINLGYLGNLLAPRSPPQAGEVGGNLSPLLLAVISGMLMSLTHPVSFIVFFGMISIYLLFSIILRFILSNFKLYIINYAFKKEILPFFIFCLFAIPVILYYKSQFSVPPWNHMAAWEGITQYFIPLKDYALTIGPTFFLAPLGLLALLFSKQIRSLINREPDRGLERRVTRAGEPQPRAQSRQLADEHLLGLASGRTRHQNSCPERAAPDATSRRVSFSISLLLLSWILSFFILFYFSYPFLTISQVRFMQNFVFIPLGILAALGLVWLANLLKSFSRLSISLNTLYLILATLIIVPSLPAYYRSLEFKLTLFTPSDPLMFPDKKWVEAIKWLGKNSNPEEVVISAWHAGHAIPYLGGNTVYVGHLWATINRQQKQEKLYKFLNAQMTNDEIKNFLRDSGGSYLFFGWQEKLHPLKPDALPFFTKIFDNEAVQIYKIVL